MREWRNWQTRMIQVHVLLRACRFKSCFPHQTNVIRIGCSLWAMGSDDFFVPNQTNLRIRPEGGPAGQEKQRKQKRGTEPASGPVPLRLSSGHLVGRAIVPFSLHGLLTLPLGIFPLTFLALNEGHDVRLYAPGKGLHSRFRPLGLVDRRFLFSYKFSLFSMPLLGCGRFAGLAP